MPDESDPPQANAILPELPKVNLRSEGELRRVRSAMRWLQDSGSALILGGATVALTLVCPALPIERETFVALELLYGLLLVASSALFLKATVALGHRHPLPLWLSSKLL